MNHHEGKRAAQLTLKELQIAERPFIQRWATATSYMQHLIGQPRNRQPK
jgi:hypothetical protein